MSPCRSSIGVAYTQLKETQHQPRTSSAREYSLRPKQVLSPRVRMSVLGERYLSIGYVLAARRELIVRLRTESETRVSARYVPKPDPYRAQICTSETRTVPCSGIRDSQPRRTTQRRERRKNSMYRTQVC
eukprot:440587-Rhodomonas_salina.1